MIISVGELNMNKNHRVIIKAVEYLKDMHIKYIVCGQGQLKGYLEQVITSCGLDKQVMLLGYRTDIKELLCMSDLFALPSKREGLGLAALEAMAVGLPVVCSNIRGNKDLLLKGKWLVEQSPKAYRKAIIEVMKEKQEYTALSVSCDRKAVEKEYRRIYMQVKKDRELWQRKENKIQHI